MKYNKIFIDASNLYHRAYSVSGQMTTVLENKMEIVTGGIYTSIKMIQKIEKNYLEDNGEIYIIFDNVHSGENKRKLIDPEYKANRSQKDETFYKSLDYFHLLLLNYKNNFIVVKRPGSEADDLVSPLIEEFKNDKILLISNDMDWFRAINENIHVAKYENKEYKIYDIDSFKEKYNFFPSEKNIIIYKAFRGDSSDNIPKGVSGIRETLIINLLEDGYSSIKEILLNLDKINYIPDSWKQKILENRARLLLNEKLVAYEKVPIEELKEYIFVCKFSPKVLKSIYKSLDFNASSFDPRILQFFPEKKKASSFFEFEVIPRE
jgi:5'-3' exonuclease